MKILIIDDEEDIRYVCGSSLEMIGGVNVFEADGGKKGLELAQAEKPDAILLDMIMPDMDGSATITALKKNPETASIPVIFLTTRTLSLDFARMKSLGAAGWIVKPFDPMTITDQIKEIINK